MSDVSGNRTNGKPKDNFTKYLVIGMVSLVILSGAAAAFYNKSSSSVRVTPVSALKADGNGIQVNPTAKVRVDFYEDFRCPNCRNFEAINNTYITGLVDAGKINAVYHPMSFIASDSVLTAAAAACADDQGKYVKYHELLYANQPSSDKVPERTAYWTNDSLITLGKAAGITSPKFASCVSSGQYLKWAANMNTYAASKSINATPTVLVNGKALPLATDYDAKAFTKVFTDLGIK